jgi:glycosyltransferase involved in cell wall biosynthesis
MSLSEATKMPGPLKILMIAPTPYFSDRGCHVRIYEEARALITRGHQVRIVSYHLGRDPEPVPVDRIPSLPWYDKREAGPSWHKLYLDLLLLCKVMGIARRFKPDLVHAHLHEGALIGWVAARLRGIPLLFDYQGSLCGESLNHGFFRNGSLQHRLFRWIEGTINRLADLIITSSTPAVEELSRMCKQDAGRVIAFPDGVDTTVFRHHPRKEARQQLGLDEEVPVVVYLGLLNRYQGIDLLLQAAKLLIQQGRMFHLVIMGYPDQLYRQKADDLHVASFITFTGLIDYARAPQMLAVGDLAVSPKMSATEANGKLLNYMACGLPVVAFETPVNRELLGADGIYATFGDAADLANCMAAALGDREQLRQRGRRLRQRAVDLHGWECRAQVLESIYQRLLAVEK